MYLKKIEVILSVQIHFFFANKYIKYLSFIAIETNKQKEVKMGNNTIII